MAALTVAIFAALFSLTVHGGHIDIPAVFVVLGDWGRCADGDWSRSTYNATNCQFQTDVGKAMGHVCQTEGCDFAINVGDNFYDLGIDATLGASDPQWMTSFNNIYYKSSLKKIKFYSILGNHDYGKNGTCNTTLNQTCKFHSIYPQIDYTNADPLGRWYMPSRYYHVDLTVRGKAIHLTATDTSPNYDGYCTVGTNKYNTAELRQLCAPAVRAADVAHFKRSTAFAQSRKMWNIVFGHHAVVGVTAPYEPMSSSLLPIIQANTPQMWFNGHDHIDAHFQTDAAPKTQFFTSGNAGTYEPNVLSNGTTTRYPFVGRLPGFVIGKIYTNYTKIIYYEVTSFPYSYFVAYTTIVPK